MAQPAAALIKFISRTAEAIMEFPRMLLSSYEPTNLSLKSMCVHPDAKLKILLLAPHQQVYCRWKERRTKFHSPKRRSFC